MKFKGFTVFGIALLSVLFIAGAQVTASAQGRGRGGGGGNPGMGGGPGGSQGVGGGLGTASGRSGGRSDDGLGNASGRSNGRSDDGLDRARARGENRENERRRGDEPRTEEDLHRFQGISRKLNTTPETLRSQYEAARAANPNLKFGQFVAANVVADNLGATHSNITTAAILSGLQSGRSIGQTLQDLGLSNSEAKLAEKNAKREIEHSRK
jgi:hypothetical protein